MVKTNRLTEFIKEKAERLFNRKKINVWHFDNVKMIDCRMVAEMNSEEFDDMANESKAFVPIIDGHAYIYLETSSYPIIVKRKDKVPDGYGD